MATLSTTPPNPPTDYTSGCASSGGESEDDRLDAAEWMDTMASPFLSPTRGGATTDTDTDTGAEDEDDIADRLEFATFHAGPSLPRRRSWAAGRAGTLSKQTEAALEEDEEEEPTAAATAPVRRRAQSARASYFTGWGRSANNNQGAFLLSSAHRTTPRGPCWSKGTTPPVLVLP